MLHANDSLTGWQDDTINDSIQIRRFIAMDNPSIAARVAGRIRAFIDTSHQAVQ
jgi:hypothetical protein